MGCQAGAYGRTGRPGKGAFGWLWRVREAGRRDGVSVTEPGDRSHREWVGTSGFL